ncbi:RNA-binding protein 48 [Cloeon dipterum]|uniref:RNA-binding protein 48 n=1 Tax=Cloeon dipterum TaxID=197152 RepID=UPI0032201BED
MEILPHHVQQNLCTSRPQYRQGRKLTAVKVYTIAGESRHLLFHGVPDLNLRDELKTKLSKYGKLESLAELPNYKDAEQFTKVYHAVFCDIKNARFTKRKLDATSFYGGVFHVCYAPEMENVEEVKLKMDLRKADVLKRLRTNSRSTEAKSNFKLEEYDRNIPAKSISDNQQYGASSKGVIYGPQLPTALTQTETPELKITSKMFIPRQLQKRAFTALSSMEMQSNKRARKD